MEEKAITSASKSSVGKVSSNDVTNNLKNSPEKKRLNLPIICKLGVEFHTSTCKAKLG